MASSTCLRKSFRLTGSSPASSRCALRTVRRYLVTLTPGIPTGYWKAMNRPIRARSSGSASVISLPSSRISPSVTSRLGWPMIAFASVDLPDPFGPIIACTLPLSTVRSSPLRISRSPAVTYRFLISSCAICLRPVPLRHRGLGRLPFGELHELGERGAVQRLHYPALHAHPQKPGGAGSARVALVGARDTLGRQRDEAVHRRDRALEGQHYLVHLDLVRRARQAVAAVGAAGGRDEPGALQVGHDVLQVGEREPLGRRDRLERGRLVGMVASELDHEPHPVLRLRREDHRRNPSSGVGLIWVVRPPDGGAQSLELRL